MLRNWFMNGFAPHEFPKYDIYENALRSAKYIHYVIFLFYDFAYFSFMMKLKNIPQESTSETVISYNLAT